MNRKTFIKTLLGSGLASVIPFTLFSKTKDKTEYTFDELFTRMRLNKILVIPKVDTNIYKSIVDSIDSDRFNNKFSHYLPVHQITIPVKDTYTLQDFDSFIYYIQNRKKLKLSLSESNGKYLSFFRLIDNNNGFMHFELFIAP